MYSGVINKTTPPAELLEVLTGYWNEYDVNEWHIVRSPFFLVITSTLDAGKHVLPFTFNEPVAAILSENSGNVKAAIVRPGQNAVTVSNPCLFKMQLFGNQAVVKAT